MFSRFLSIFGIFHGGNFSLVRIGLFVQFGIRHDDGHEICPQLNIMSKSAFFRGKKGRRMMNFENYAYGFIRFFGGERKALPPIILPTSLHLCILVPSWPPTSNLELRPKPPTPLSPADTHPPAPTVPHWPGVSPPSPHCQIPAIRRRFVLWQIWADVNGPQDWCKRIRGK